MTVRVPIDLFDRAYTLAAVSGESLRDIVSRGLEHALDEMMDRGNSEFESAVSAVQRYKESIEES